MTNFNVSFETKKGKLNVYEGEGTIVLRQEQHKVIIPFEDWNKSIKANK